MMAMGDLELERYARACGVDVSGVSGREARVAAIEERRGRVGEVRLMGETFAVPARRLHDKRVADLMGGGYASLSDEAASAVMGLLLGEEQYLRLVDLCTDEDGVVDAEAMACAFVALTSDEGLKNY